MIKELYLQEDGKKRWVVWGSSSTKKNTYIIVLKIEPLVSFNYSSANVETLIPLSARHIITIKYFCMPLAISEVCLLQIHENITK